VKLSGVYAYNGIMEAIELNQVVKTFDGTRAVDGVSLTIPRGTIYGLLGPNGAGKTTTIRMITDIYRPDEGEIRIFGDPPGYRVQHRIGYLPEERGLYRKMKVIEQLVFLGELKQVPAKEARKRAMEYLERFDLAEWALKKVEQLSKGMQQKVQFIGTVLHDPDLIILDEPFSGLDPVNQALLKEEIQGFVDRGKTVIFSTHVLPQAEQLCRDICLINHGKKVLDGHVEEIKARFAEPVILLTTDAEVEELRADGAHVVRRNGHVEVRLDNSLAPEAYLAELFSRHIPIQAFGPKEIDLESIFIKVVKDESL